MEIPPRGWLISWAKPALNSPKDSSFVFWIKSSCCCFTFLISFAILCSKLLFNCFRLRCAIFLRVTSEVKTKFPGSPSQFIPVTF